MPYKIYKRDAKYYVYTIGADGKPTGSPHNKEGYANKQDALPLMRALYSAMKRGGEITAEFDVTLLSPDGAGMEQVYTQDEVHYTQRSDNPDERCGKCVFWNGSGCNLVINEPMQIVAEGWCDQYLALSVIAPGGQEAGVTDVTEMARDLPIASGDPSWDAGAARSRIWQWASNDDGSLNFDKAKQAFLVVDPGEGETKGALKDPIADVVDGHLVVIPAALRAASGAHGVPGTDSSGKSGAEAVLAHYKAKAHIGEFERAALEDTIIKEYKGKFPDVPDAPGVDKKALTEGDTNPTFVIRPIAQVGRRSGNGVLYDQALITSIAEQINSKRPGGIFGHIRDEDRKTAHPQPQAYWIGAKQYGDTLWAKAYIADMERAKDIRRKKALGSADGTSIYGVGDKRIDPDGTQHLTNFVLESLDFAPLERASLDMGKEMYLVGELYDPSMAAVNTTADEPEPEPNDPNLEAIEEGNTEMTEQDVAQVKQTHLAELQAMPGDALCAQMGNEAVGRMVASHMQQNKMKMVAAEMSAVEPAVVSEMEAQRETIKELREFKAAAVQEKFDRTLGDAIAEMTPYTAIDDGQKAALAQTRTVLEMSVRASLKDNTDAENVAEAVKTVAAAMPTVLEMLRDRMMGPSARVGLIDNHTRAQDTSRYYSGVDVNDPAFQEAARIRVGA